MSNRTLPHDHDQRMERVRLSLDGLSVGDAFGQRFFGPVGNGQTIGRVLPPAPWRYTDDTEMALAIAHILSQHGTIAQDELAQEFAARYAVDPHRGYGAGMHNLLAAVGNGDDWRVESRHLFRGEGSFGNGSAMRVAPVGAYFADDFERVVEEAKLSAEVTHAHEEAVAGAIAVAIAAAWAWQERERGPVAPTSELLETVYEHLPAGKVCHGIHVARQLPLDEWEFTAAENLGCGEQITCADTVPFCLWIAARHLDDYQTALWNTVRVGGDIDTNAAIVGGIVALAVGREKFPEDWRKMREGLVWQV